MSAFENRMGRVPSSASAPPSGHALHAARTASGSTVSGARPWRPATMASGVPWPSPVAPSDPYSVQATRSMPSSRSASRRRVAKWWAARMGPTVWELEGPTPMENSSNAETYALTLSAYAPQSWPLERDEADGVAFGVLDECLPLVVLRRAETVVIMAEDHVGMRHDLREALQALERIVDVLDV